MKTSAMFWIVQILGVLVFIFNIYGNTKLSTKKVYFFNGLCNLLCVIQYLLLGAWTGVICDVIAIARNIVFDKYKKNVPLYILLIYIALIVLCNYSSIHSWIDIIPVINVIVYGIALWTKDIMDIKATGVFTCCIGIIYDITTGAYVTAVNEVIDGTVGTRCILILNKEKKKKSKRKKKR